MIDPPRPPSMIFCAPAITVFQVPMTLTSITSRMASGVISFQAAGADRFVEVLRCRRVVGHTRRQLAREIDRDDVGALGGHPNRMRAALPPWPPR